MQDLSERVEHPEVLDSDQRWQVVKRLAASEHFRRSHRLRRFLLFVSELALTGRGEEIGEHLIGCRVFDRPNAYSPSDDNIVRSSARQLRSKVKEYFETEGKDELWVMEMPKGSYVPTFHRREALPVEIEPPAPARPAPPKGRLGLAILCMFLAAACVWLALRAYQKPSRPTLASVLLLEAASSVSFVPADSALVLMNVVNEEPLRFDDFASRRYLSNPPPGSGPDMLRLWGVLSTRQTTSLADLTFVSQILKAHPEYRDRLGIRHPRNARARDFKTGSFIIHGAPGSNPWAGLFEDKLNFCFVERTPGILNRKPKEGELPAYVGREEGKKSIGYARIALLRNPGGSGKVLLVAGGTMESSEAAGDFVMNPASLALVQRAMGGRDLSKVERLELLLETVEVDGAPGGTRLLAFR